MGKETCEAEEMETMEGTRLEIPLVEIRTPYNLLPTCVLSLILLFLDP